VQLALKDEQSQEDDLWLKALFEDEEIEMSKSIPLKQLIPAKFNGSNYVVWSFSMERLFRTAKLFDIVTGTSPRPAETDTAAAVKAWDDRNEEAITFLAMAIEESRLLSLISLPTAKQWWDRLSTVHGQVSATGVTLKEREWSHYAMVAGTSVESHIGRIETMSGELARLGK
jgi:hypothetical protein